MSRKTRGPAFGCSRRSRPASGRWAKTGILEPLGESSPSNSPSFHPPVPSLPQIAVFDFRRWVRRGPKQALKSLEANRLYRIFRQTEIHHRDTESKEYRWL